MPLKSKVKFTESQAAKLNKDNAAAPDQSGSDNVPIQATPTTVSKIKSKRKSKAFELLSSDYNEDDTNEDGLSRQDFQARKSLKSSVLTFSLALSDPDKNVSDGSISDEEVPQVKWSFLGEGEGEDIARDGACPTTMARECAANDGANIPTAACSVATKLTVSQKVTPCMKSDDQKFATSDYTASTALSFLPNLIHPINGQVSTFTRHRDYTNYLRDSGCLKLFGTCILNVYRMKKWPPPEKLIEQILNSMDYQIPVRKQVNELIKQKKSLIDHFRTLTKERCQLLEKLDKYEDFAANYELLDQDEILPPRPENTSINMELLTEIFKNMEHANTSIESSDPGEQDQSTDIKVLLSKDAPISNTLPIPEHDKRMLL